MSNDHMPFEVFCSYTYQDEPLFQKLETHLSVLKRQGLISTWNVQQIIPGTNRIKAIDQRLEQASIILLLVSADFLASDYHYQTEIEYALKQHEAGLARVIPIIVRPCDWNNTSFALLQCLPRDGRAITIWDNRDLAWNNVIEGIRLAIEDLYEGTIRASPLQGQAFEGKRQGSSKVSNEGILSLKRGSQALWDTGYNFAKKELRKAVEGIDEEVYDREASQARYFLALALLGGKVPRIQGREVMLRIDELMEEAIRIHPYASYYRIFAQIKKDFFQFNGLSHRLNEVAILEHKGASFPRCRDDEEMEEYFRHCQPRLPI